MAKKGMKGLNMLVLGGGGLLLVVLFFLGAYKVKEGFQTIKAGETITDSSIISNTNITPEKARADLQGNCRFGREKLLGTSISDGKFSFDSATVTGISVKINGDGTYTASGTCNRLFTALTNFK